MPKLYLIHPAVGCARMGNSQNGVQIAPEVPYSPSIGSFMDVIQDPAIQARRPDLVPNPPASSFRGADGNIRRQGVRFRIFEYDFEPTLVSKLIASVFEGSRSRKAARLFIESKDNFLKLPPGAASPREVTAAEFDIEWTVTLANKKTTGWNITGANPQGHLEESDIAFTYNNNSSTRTVTIADIARDGIPVVALQEPNRLKLGDMLVEPTGQMILIGSAGDTKAPAPLMLRNKLGDLFNRGWEDDAADGPVTARVRRKGTSDWIEIGDQEDAHWNGNAWAVVGPPRFGGDVTPIVSLHDVALSLAAAGKCYVQPSGVSTSYSRDIYPILRGMAMATQVYASAHTRDSTKFLPRYERRNYHGPGKPFFLDPDTAALDEAGGGPSKAHKALYFNMLIPPDEIVIIDDPYPAYTYTTSEPDSLGILYGPIAEFDGTKTKVMPRLIGLSLTHLQYEHMKAWRDGTFTNDWNPTLPPSSFPPLNIDLTHMRSICGGSFIPGIEVGKHIWGRDLWSLVAFLGYEPLVRLNSKNLHAGDLTQTLGNPWQYDYQECDDDWWPASRPISVEDLLPPRNHYRWHSSSLTMALPPGDEPLQHLWKEMGYIKLTSGWVVKEEERTAGKDVYPEP